MKKLSLLSALMLSFTLNAYANANHEHVNVADRLHIADASQANPDVNNALRLKFISRRAAQNPAVNNKDAQQADEEWEGATYVDEEESDASKRLNRQFKSKRPYINYQFD
ncbi:MAG: hypothetical protein KFB94_08530 [Methylophilaceae bacterium]|nr:MAG: hypothetical protein KFB94_08530 [Methylophilaceae bacterium]